MFVRFRETTRRLQVSLVETQRHDGKVRHEHVAGLGSVTRPPSVADRIAFWEHLHQRLGRLSNRIDGEAQAKIMGAVQARIPMAIPDEVRALQLEKAEAVEQQWSALQDMVQERLAGHKALRISIDREIAQDESAVPEFGSNAGRAKDRIARLKAGESVAGIDKPLTLAELGFSPAKIRHMTRLAEIGDAGFEEFLAEVKKRKDKVEHNVSAKIARRLRREP
jgi:Xaa-Pro aminopeptidase